MHASIYKQESKVFELSKKSLFFKQHEIKRLQLSNFWKYGSFNLATRILGAMIIDLRGTLEMSIAL